jgi:recombination protein RecA
LHFFKGAIFVNESDKVLAALKKTFGEHIGKIGNHKLQVPRIATGIFQFDLATGGGFPCGRLSILYGAESSGKTTMCYLAMAYVQTVLGMKAVIVDVEGTFDSYWAETCGVNLHT